MKFNFVKILFLSFCFLTNYTVRASEFGKLFEENSGFIPKVPTLKVNIPSYSTFTTLTDINAATSYLPIPVLFSSGSIKTHVSSQAFYDSHFPNNSYIIIKLVNHIAINPLDKSINYYKVSLINQSKNIDLKLKTYSPHTTGVTTSLSVGNSSGTSQSHSTGTSSEGTVGASIDIGLTGPSAGANCSQSWGTTSENTSSVEEGINSSYNEDLPPIQILAKAYSQEVHWLSKIGGTEEPQTTYNMSLKTQWRLPYIFGSGSIAFSINISAGTFDQDLLAYGHKPAKCEVGKYNYPASFYYQSIQYNLPIPLRKHVWIFDKLSSMEGKIDGYQSPSIAQRSDHTYMISNIDGKPQIMYSDDAIHWLPSKVQIDYDKLAQHSNMINYAGDLYVGLVDKDNILSLFGLLEVDNKPAWIRMKTPLMKTKQAPALTVFKNKLHLAYENLDQEKYDAIKDVQPIEARYTYMLVYGNNKTFGPKRIESIFSDSEGKECFAAVTPMAYSDSNCEASMLSNKSGISLTATENYLYLNYAYIDLSKKTNDFSTTLLTIKSINGFSNWKNTSFPQDSDPLYTNFFSQIFIKNSKVFLAQFKELNIVGNPKPIPIPYLKIYTYVNNQWYPYGSIQKLPDAFDPRKSFSIIDLEGDNFDPSKLYMSYMTTDNQHHIGYIQDEVSHSQEN